MAKVLIGSDLGSYSFNKTAKTVTFSGFKPVLEEILLITDVTNGTIIYQFNDVTKGGTLSGQVLTLTYDTNTGSFANTDSLQIFYWNEEGQDVMLKEIAISLRTLLQQIARPLAVDPAGRMKVNITASDVGTNLNIGTITTLTNANSLNGYNNIIIPAYAAEAAELGVWYSTVRSQIT